MAIAFATKYPEADPTGPGSPTWNAAERYIRGLRFDPQGAKTQIDRHAMRKELRRNGKAELIEQYEEDCLRLANDPSYEI